MEDNVLKKEFSERDVQRVRNLVTKKYGESTGIQTGYSKISVDHQEGEIWEENGKNWTIKEGIKQNITKLDSFKQLSFIPLLCPNCNNPLKTEYDKKMYRIHTQCLECVVKFETKLKIEGKYDEYSRKLIKSNVDFFLNDYEQFLEEMAKNTNVTDIVSEDGTVEKWIGNNQKSIEEAQQQLKDIKINIK